MKKHLLFSLLLTMLFMVALIFITPALWYRLLLFVLGMLAGAWWGTFLFMLGLIGGIQSGEIEIHE